VSVMVMQSSVTSVILRFPRSCSAVVSTTLVDHSVMYAVQDLCRKNGRKQLKTVLMNVNVSIFAYVLFHLYTRS
jgi:hypothetical protein